MGFYINPPDSDKETWLSKHGTRVHTAHLKEATDGSFMLPDDKGDATIPALPVCLVDNGAFTAAGVCFDAHELQDFLHPDGRFKEWFLVPISKLLEVKALPAWPLKQEKAPHA